MLPETVLLPTRKLAEPRVAPDRLRLQILPQHLNAEISLSRVTILRPIHKRAQTCMQVPKCSGSTVTTRVTHGTSEKSCPLRATIL